VTIAAGFVARDGIVLCADTQETYGQLLKLKTPKIIVRPESFIPGPRIVFAGAGHGPFIDKLANEAWKMVSTKTSAGDFADVCDEIESSIKDTHGEFGRIFQSGAMPDAELIYGVAVGGRKGLSKATGPIVNPVERYAWPTIFPNRGRLPIEGCGGDSHVLTLTASGKIPADVVLIANHINFLDRNSSTVLMSTPDLKLSDEELDGRIEIFVNLARNLRKEHREDRKRIEAMREGNPLYKIMKGNKEKR
jgi:hypothetical protein